MTIDLTPNYDEKTLQVAFSLKGRKEDRGFVFNPQNVRSDTNPIAGRMYDEFLARGEYESVEITTHQGPGELAGMLGEKFEVDRTAWVGGMAAQLNATLPQAKSVIRDLRDNPQDYYASPEEEEFGEGSLVL